MTPRRLRDGRDGHVTFSDERRTITLPHGSVSFDGEILDVWQVDDTFVLLVDVRDGTPNAVVAVDEHGNERWRHDGFDAIYDSGRPHTIIAKDAVARVTFDARTGAQLDVQQHQ